MQGYKSKASGLDEEYFYAQGQSCIYQSERLVRGTNTRDNREWHKRSAELPRGNYKVRETFYKQHSTTCVQLYALATYDGTQRYNTGQVAIADISVYNDRSLNQRAC